MMGAKAWIISWFETHTAAREVAQHTQENFLERGWIDSLSFISFITDLENHFKINISYDEFQSPDFSTIDGLAEVVEKKNAV